MTEGERIPSPEERTAEFFDANVEQVAERIKGRRIVLRESGKYIIPLDVAPWKRADVKKGFQAMYKMEAGSLVTFPYPFRKTHLTYVVAKDQGETGACVRILKALIYDPKIGTEIKTKKEGDIASYLGLEEREVAKLSFVDNTESLFIKRTKENSRQEISPQEANDLLDKLLNSN